MPPAAACTVVIATQEPNKRLLATGARVAAAFARIRPETGVVGLCTSAFLLAAAGLLVLQRGADGVVVHARGDHLDGDDQAEGIGGDASCAARGLPVRHEDVDDGALGGSPDSVQFSARKPTWRELRRRQLEEAIGEIFGKSGGTYGSPKVFIELVRSGRRVSVNTVAKIMAELGLAGRPAPRRAGG